MSWEILNIIGTIAFAVSGALVAMEEEFDIYGVIVLGMATAFGEGIVRNLFIGIPVPTLWSQSTLLWTALIAMIILFLLPGKWIHQSRKYVELFDAVGLAAFAIQGALYAAQIGRPLSAIMVAAILTGIGGGMIRDVLAGRKPYVLKEDIYAIWAMLAGFIIGMGWVSLSNPVQLSALCGVIVILRMLSVYYRWSLPRRRLQKMW